MKTKIQEIKEILSKNNISYKTNLQDGDTLSCINSILDADSESIIFLFDEKYSINNINTSIPIKNPIIYTYITIVMYSFTN